MKTLRRLSVLISMLICLYTCTQAQKQIVSGNDDIATNIPDSVKYLYPAFTYGKVYYKDGNSGGSLLNYNLLAAAIQFISQPGDTLSLANEATIRFVIVGKDTFYYDNVYVKIIASNAEMKLARSEKISLSNIKKGAAFDSYRSAGGVENVSALNVGSRTVHLEDNKQMIFVVHNMLYIGDTHNHFLPATKKNALKMFGKNKGFDEYISEHNVDFSKEEDLKALLGFVASKG